MNYLPRVMKWVYQWGETNAWIIKIGLLIVGFILTKVGGKNPSSN